jgi:hypothetical protein
VLCGCSKDVIISDALLLLMLVLGGVVEECALRVVLCFVLKQHCCCCCCSCRLCVDDAQTMKLEDSDTSCLMASWRHGVDERNLLS